MPDKVELRSAIKKNDGWWATIFAGPLANKILFFIADFSFLTPNLLTSLSLFIGVLASICFVIHSQISLIIAALLVQLSFVFDCMDGQLARFQGSSSNFGAWFDRICDRVKDFLYCFSLALGWFLKNKVESTYDLEPWLVWPLAMLSFFCLFLIDYYVNQDVKLEATVVKKAELTDEKKYFHRDFFMRIMKFGLIVYKKIPILRFNIGEQALLLSIFTLFQEAVGFFIFCSFLGLFYCFYWPFAKIYGFTISKKNA